MTQKIYNYIPIETAVILLKRKKITQEELELYMESVAEIIRKITLDKNRKPEVENVYYNVNKFIPVDQAWTLTKRNLLSHEEYETYLEAMADEIRKIIQNHKESNKTQEKRKIRVIENTEPDFVFYK